MEGSMACSALFSFIRFAIRGRTAAVFSLVACSALSAVAQNPQGPGLMPAGDVAQGNIGAGEATTAAVGEHPLEPALALARKGLTQLRSTIKDYSCTVVKRERIDGKLNEHEYMTR
jgi:hypothetical protein